MKPRPERRACAEPSDGASHGRWCRTGRRSTSHANRELEMRPQSAVERCIRRLEVFRGFCSLEIERRVFFARKACIEFYLV